MSCSKALLSFLISFLIIWGVGYVFCNSLLVYEYDGDLEKYIPKADQYYHKRTEGWATTRIGKYNINAIADITAITDKKIMAWGDSHVQAYEVDDADKFPQQVTDALSRAGHDGLVCVGTGMGGDSVADLIYDIPKYERLIEGLVYHVVIISNMDDVLPDQATDRLRGRFRSNPYRLVYQDWKPGYQNIKRILNEMGLYFLWNPIKRIQKGVKLNFLPVRIEKDRHRPGDIVVMSPSQIREAIGFLLGSMSNCARRPIVCVYAPEVAVIRGGSISFEDPNRRKFEMLAEAVEEYNIAVIDLSDNLKEAYLHSGQLPRGFQNTIPGTGHFNKLGHKVLADAITQHILERQSL